MSKKEGEFVKESILNQEDTITQWDKIRQQFREKWDVTFREKLKTVGDVAFDVSSLIQYINSAIEVDEASIYSSDLNPAHFDKNKNVLPLDSFVYPPVLGHDWAKDSFSLLICKLDTMFRGKQDKFIFNNKEGPFSGNKFLVQAYENPKLFKSSWRSSPPPEQKSSVLNLELTTGCDYGKCTFCDLYENSIFTQKSLKEFKQHYFDVMEAIKNHPVPFKRIFLGAGNSLAVKQKDLVDILTFLREENEGVNQFSTFARAKSVLKKSVEDLTELHNLGLSMVYVGAESGNDDVLKYINKGCTSSEIISAADSLHEAGVNISATFMLGIGGTKYANEHVKDTIKLINRIQPHYVTFVGLDISPNSKYSQQIAEEKDNCFLTEEEKIIQGKEMLRSLNFYNQRVSVARDLSFSKGIPGAHLFNRTFDNPKSRKEIVTDYLKSNKTDKQFFNQFFPSRN